MKYALPLWTILIILPMHSADAAVKPAADVPSSIVSVTVFNDQALITRQASLSVAAGPAEFVFSALPESLVEQSVQVFGEGTARATVLNVRAERTFLDVTPTPRMRELQEKLRALNRQLETLRHRLEALAFQKEYLADIRRASTQTGQGGSARLPSVDEWRGLMEFLEARWMEIAGEEQRANRERQETEEEIRAVERQLKAEQGDGRLSRKAVHVLLDVHTPGALTLNLSYLVRDASWQPRYDLRLSAEDDRISVRYGAAVRQATGEDWSGVDLTLSSARPSVGARPPVLRPWILDQVRERAVRQYELEAAEVAVRAGARAPALDYDVAAVEEQAFTSTFSIPRRVSIPSDNAEHRVGITSHDLDAALSLYAVPKLAERAYVKAAVTNTTDYPMLAGPVSVYSGNQYVSTTAIPTVSPGQSFEVFLGVDDGVTVSRNLVNRLTEYTGLLTKRNRVTYDFVISVQNNRRTERRIEIVDQLPVSRNERIDVRLITDGMEQDDGGRLTWTMELAPGEKRELPLRFTIEHPESMTVAGL